MAHVFAHTYADNCNVRCTHTTHTHTHVHTAGCPRACACTGASSPPTHRADTPTDQGHSTRSLVCCTACTSASVPACPAKNFAPLGPRAAFLSVRPMCARTPSPTFPNLLASVANFLAHLLPLLASTLQICTAILCMHCNLHCNCIRCRFCDQGMRNLHALQHLQDLQIGLQLCAICLQIWLAHVHACFCCIRALALHAYAIATPASLRFANRLACKFASLHI